MPILLDFFGWFNERHLFSINFAIPKLKFTRIFILKLDHELYPRPILVAGGGGGMADISGEYKFQIDNTIQHLFGRYVVLARMWHLKKLSFWHKLKFSYP